MGRSATTPTACTRCGGLMAVEEFTDMREGITQGTFVGGRCLNCGHIADPVITGNRDRAADSGMRLTGRSGGRSRPSKGPAYLTAERMMRDV